MARAFKVAGIVLASLMAIVALLVIALVLFINPNDYKKELAEAVRNKTDMELVLTGELSWQVYPSIGIKLGKTSLTDPQLKETLVAVEQAAVSVELMPLLTKKVSIDAVILDGAAVRFVQYADGKTSWDHLLEKLKSPEEEESEQVAFAIEDLDISNTRITAIDKAGGTTRELEQVAVQASNISPDDEFPFEAQFRFSQKDGAGKTLVADNRIAGQVTLGLELQQYQLRDFAIQSGLSGSLLPAPVDIDLKAARLSADVPRMLHEVEGLKLALTYKDPALKQPATARLDADIKADLGKQVIRAPGLLLQASYQDKVSPAPMDVELKTDAEADLVAGSAALKGLRITGKLADKSLPKPVPFSLTVSLDANWKTGAVALRNLILQGAGIRLDGSVSGALPALASGAQPVTRGMNLSGNLRSNSFDVRQVMASLGQDVKQVPANTIVKFSTDIVANGGSGQVGLRRLDLQLADIKVSGDVMAVMPALVSGGQPLLRGMALGGSIQTSSFNPRQLMTRFGITPPVTRSKTVLQKASLKADIAGNEKEYLARNLRLQLDGSTLTGEAGVRELPASRLYARLAVDSINVDDYLPPETAAAAGKASAATPAEKAEAILPVDLLRSQNLDVALTAGSLVVIDYPIKQLRVAATARGGLVNVSELRGNIENGSFSVPMSIDVRGAQPVVSMNPVLKEIDLGPIAKKALKQDVFDGRMNFQGAVKVTGNTTDAWIRSAQGPNTLRLDNGVIKGINVTDALFNALGKYQALLPALTGRDAATLKGKVRNTEIVSMLGETSLSQGVVSNNSMKADLKDIQVGGSGTYNLITQAVDYRFQLKLDKKFWGEKYAKMAEYPIPVRCNGNLKGSLATLCGLDSQGMQGLAAQMAKARLGEELDKEKGKLQDKVTEKLGDKLNPQQQEAVKQLFDIFKQR